MVSAIPTFADAIMPRSTIKNCAKTVLKEDTNIQKDALTALTRGSTVFISYLTAYANDIALSKKRKTIMPADVLEALKLIEFERFVPEMQALSESIDNEAREKRERKKAETTDVVETQNQVEDVDEDGINAPTTKKVRIANGDAAGVQRTSEPHNIEDPEDEEPENSDEDVADDDEGDNAGEEDEDEDDADEDGDDSGNKEDGEPQTIVDGPDAIEEFENRQVDTYDEVLDNGEDSDAEEDVQHVTL